MCLCFVTSHQVIHYTYKTPCIDCGTYMCWCHIIWRFEFDFRFNDPFQRQIKTAQSDRIRMKTLFPSAVRRSSLANLRAPGTH